MNDSLKYVRKPVGLGGTWLVVGSFVSLILIHQGVAQDEFSKTDFQQCILQTDEKIHSLYAEFEIDGYSDEYPAGYYSHQCVFWKDPDFLYQLSTHGHDQLDWWDDPTQQEAFIIEHRFFRFNDVNRTVFPFRLDPGSHSLPGMFEASTFFIATGWWPHQRWDAFRPNDLPVVLREVAIDEAYQLDSNPQVVDGQPCRLLERKKSDRIWADVSEGFRLLRRELVDPESGQVMQVFDYFDHQEIWDGIHFAMEIRLRQFGETAKFSPYQGSETERSCRLKFSRVLINQDNFEDMPEMALDPGTLLYREQGDSQQIRAGGEDHLAHMANWIAKYGQQRTVEQSVGNSIWNRVVCSIVFLVAALVCIQVKLPKLVLRTWHPRADRSG